MLRAMLLYLSKAAWARQVVTKWPLAWKVSSRFVAGESLEDAIRAIKALNAKGIYATLDHLGEHTTTPEEALRARAHIVQALHAIKKEGLQSNVSLKLTQLGIELDDFLCAENLAYILGIAREYGIFVRIDMEDSPYVDRTLNIYRFLVNQVGCETVGVVLQSMLYRSMEDVENLLKEMPTRVRLVKGAYREPPEIAYPKKRDSDTNFDRMTDALIQGALRHGVLSGSEDGKVPPIPAIASQDAVRIDYAKQAAAAAGIPKRAIEFQMLHGIRRDLQEQLVAEGYPVRVYVPYGKQWYPYFMRRLAERPANLWFFISNFFRK